ncbi:endonuclease/exonuclease/phosphatase family protein [Salinarimonas rosea]|uniref:endonuclease/exonuclease/phosphatase family protein n=1 Tax=Salinarimonas rosea TaxID=552063 RepID=UPI0004291874|nr:endonuclease/exonuclease/phosphatase family protein [Salinarimonas rosea]
MRIGTWNLSYAMGAAKNALRRRILEEADCDVWVLTETHDAVDLGPTHEPVHAAPRPDRRAGERWVTIWTRFPVRARPATADPERTAAAVLAAPSGDLLVFGTVLPWHSDRGRAPPGVPVRNWSEHHRVIPEQGREWQALRNAWPDAALVVAGDLNTDLGGAHYYGTRQGRAALEKAMCGCGLACATRTPLVPPGRLAHPPIDHVLVPEGWAERTQVCAAWEGRRDGAVLSDHSGIAVSVSGP